MISSLLLSEQFSAYVNCDGDVLPALSPIAQINMLVGANNSGKSRFMRLLAREPDYNVLLGDVEIEQLTIEILEVIDQFEQALKERQLIAANEVNLSVIDKLKSLKPHLNTNRDNFKEARYHLEQWQNIRNINNTQGNYDTLSGITGDSPLAEKIRSLAKQGLGILAQIPIYSESDSIPRIYIPILRGLRPLDQAHTDLYKNRTKEDYFQPRGFVPEWITPDIFTGLSFYNRLTELLLGNNSQRKLINSYQQFLSRKLFEGRDVALIPSLENKVVTVKIGKEAEQPIHHLGDGVQAAIILSFLPFITQRPSFFFIEEPEAHLHPGLQRKVLELFAEKMEHTFFLSTHSNHLLDITIDLKNISIFTFQKQVQHDSDDDEQTATVKIEAVDIGDNSSLEQLGVRNSSVFLVNATVWVEGITDRWYLRAFLKSYVEHLAAKDPKVFKPEEDAHYSFVEYGGNNITHWSFLDMEKRPIEVKRLCARALLVIDEDGGDKKLPRKEALQKELGERLHILAGREIENLLPPSIIRKVIATYENAQEDEIPAFDYKNYQKLPLGSFIEQKLTSNGTIKRRGGYASDSGTIKTKTDFCNRATELLSGFDFKLLPKPAQEIARKIYDFIKESNSV